MSRIAPGTVLDGFRVGDCLHAGGMGSIHAATYADGAPDPGFPMVMKLPRLGSDGAGSIVGSGTIANEDTSKGASCFAEKRTVETLETGRPVTPLMAFSDTVRIEMLDKAGNSIFGAIEQRIEHQAPPA